MAYLVQKTIPSDGYNEESAVHVLKKDDTGILYYSKIKYFGDSGEINLSDGQGFPFSLDQIETGLATDGETFINETNMGADEGTNIRQYNYLYRVNDQMKIENKKVTYFINSTGFLVARYNADYAYSTTQNGATNNYVAS